MMEDFLHYDFHSSLTNYTSNNTWDYYFYPFFDPFCLEFPVNSYILLSFSISSLLLGLPASIWLVWALVQRLQRGLTNDIYMFNLTIMDLIFNLCVAPSTLNFFVWQLKGLNKFTDLVYFFNIGGRPLFMACMCMDCYCAVLWPAHYIKIRETKHRAILSALVWVFTLSHGSVLVFADHLVGFSFFMIPYILSVPTIFVCDVIILHALRKPGPSGKVDIHPQKQRALGVITSSLVMTLISYLPPMVAIGVAPRVGMSVTERWCNVVLPSFIGPLLGSTIMSVMSLQNLGYLNMLKRQLASCL